MCMCFLFLSSKQALKNLTRKENIHILNGGLDSLKWIQMDNPWQSNNGPSGSVYLFVHRTNGTTSLGQVSIKWSHFQSCPVKLNLLGDLKESLLISSQHSHLILIRML